MKISVNLILNKKHPPPTHKVIGVYGSVMVNTLPSHLSGAGVNSNTTPLHVVKVGSCMPSMPVPYGFLCRMVTYQCALHHSNPSSACYEVTQLLF